MTILSLFFMYHLFFFLLGLTVQRRKLTNEHPVKSKLAVVLPAHNEEKVISSSVGSILNCSYPKELFDVFVIADNCTDGTAREAAAAGAIVLERFNQSKSGKQYALEWAFENIQLDNYDAVVVLDSDNHVRPGFLWEMDNQLQMGNKVIQGYVETKNPGDSWVTANYAYMFWYLCRMQMARSVVGLSSWLAGTGFCVSTSVLRRTGWNVVTMCDDMEYTAQLLIAGEKVQFAPNAICYDEKPVTLKDSLKQRLRWLRGQTQVTLRYWPRLVKKVITAWWQGDVKAAARAFDGVMWVPMHIVVIASILITAYTAGPISLLQMLMTVPCFMMLPMVAESIRNARAWKYLLTAGIFYYTWLPIMFYGVATCGNKNWWRTPHGV